MRQAFLFVQSQTVVDGGGDVDLSTILDRTAIVMTADTIGSAVIVGDKLVTSLLLVGTAQRVDIRFQHGKKMPAFVTRRDHGLNLAELTPSIRLLSSPGTCHSPLASSPHPRVGRRRDIGSPILVADTATGATKVLVAANLYNTRVGERWEDSWKIEPHRPAGIIGGAAWSDSGEFLGVAIGQKTMPSEYLRRAGQVMVGIPTDGSDPAEDLRPRVYVVSAEQVMEFVETS